MAAPAYSLIETLVDDGRGLDITLAHGSYEDCRDALAACSVYGRRYRIVEAPHAPRRYVVTCRPTEHDDHLSTARYATRPEAVDAAMRAWNLNDDTAAPRIRRALLSTGRYSDHSATLTVEVLS